MIGLFVIGALYVLATYKSTFNATGAPQESQWQHEYWETVPKAEKAYEAKDWGKAAHLYGEIVGLLPHEPVSRYNRATALAHLGREDEALEELRRSVEFGWADIKGLRSDPALTRIRDTSRFERLLERAKEIADEPITIYVPQGLDEKTAAPLVITFHGRGENPHSHIHSWKQAADRLGVVVAAPRGVERIGGQGKVHSFRWVTAEKPKGRGNFLLCKDLLQQSIDLAVQQANIDDSRILLAGYSEGGSVALALLADAPERFCGGVVEATSFSPSILERWKRFPPEHQLPVYVIVHEFDRMRPMGEEAYHTLKEAGINARLKVVPGADHELPLDNGARQIEAVRFVLGLDSTAP